MAKKESLKVEYSDEHGLTVHVTNEGLENLANGAADFLEATMEKVAPQLAEMTRKRIPKPEEADIDVMSVQVPMEATTGTPFPTMPPMMMKAPVTDDVLDIEVIPSPNGHPPVQDEGHGGRQLTPLEKCDHLDFFRVSTPDGLLAKVIIMGYKHTHNVPWNGAGIYCADCLSKLNLERLK